MKKIKQSFDPRDAGGTSWHNRTVTVNPAKLLAKYEAEMGDDYKISKYFTFTFNNNVYTLYDWKATEMYDSMLPSVAKFWSQDKVELHVGSHSIFGEEEFIRQLLKELGKAQ